MKIQLSELDTQRFGIVTARISVTATDSVQSILDWCDSNRVMLLIARCSSIDIRLAQQLELSGFCLGDVLVYYRCTQIARENVVPPSGYSWRKASPQDIDMIEPLASAAFTGYSGHYHSDPRLDSASAVMAYSSWARNLCASTDDSNPMFLIETNAIREPAGFLSARTTDANGLEIVLNGVDPRHQKKGLYDMLVRLAKSWAAERGIESILSSTHLTNITVQKIWCQHGFTLCASYFTFHKWFDR